MSQVLPLDMTQLAKARLTLLDHVAAFHSLDPIADATFESFEDGAMGSFTTIGLQQDRRRERVLCEFEYVDRDGVGVLVTAYSQNGIRISSFDF